MHTKTAVAHVEQDILEHRSTCPHCKSSELEALELDIDPQGFARHIRCKHCGKEFWQIYGLVGVELAEGKRCLIPGRFDPRID